MSAIAITSPSIRLPLIAGMLLTTVLGLTGVKAAEKATTTNQQLQAGKQPEAATTPQTQKPHRRWFQIGRASWYGRFFQGQSTASGESFDMNGLTCAHRSLPLGSLIRVTNLRNHKTVVVRVNDRGPIPNDRVIDLSYAAARSLGFAARGIAPVRLELLASSENGAMAPFDLRPALQR
ncbi:MAG TPA: septal ring lytic transglycosylase RlpA family protein [Acidisarcina sp.]|nr:septal ring lytic transglycosylase RlpA family protein [Acidisarcina sp.]